MHLALHKKYKGRSRVVPAQPSDQHPRCGICGWFARNQDEFDEHFEQHLLEKNFVCSHCGLDFDQLYELEAHHLTTHPESHQMAFTERGETYSRQCQQDVNIVLMDPCVDMKECDDT